MQTEVSGKVVRTAKSVAISNQASFAAYVQASQNFATGSQDLFRQTAESIWSAFTETFAGVRAMVNAKSVKEHIELQTTLFRTSAT
ncbi:MAG: phasin family protein [Janthinobacterium lividum]